MKILHLVSSAGQYGAETMLLELATALKDAGCDLVLGVFENQHSRNTQIHKSAIERGLDSRLISCSGRIDQKAVKEVRSLLQGNEIDVLHSHGYKSNLYGYLAARKANIPLVTTCHGWPGGTLALSCYYILDKVILHRFDRIIAVSESLVRSLRWAAIPNQRINCIPNGVTQVASHRCLSDEASQLPSTKRIGVVARLVPEKGIAYLLVAAKEILQKYPTTEFCLIGDGPHRGPLETLARDLGIQRNVQFWGFQSDMAGVYAKLDIFVLPSTTEGMPMTILEAMSAGKPVIATCVGGIPKVVIPGKTGILVAPRDSTSLRDAILQYLEQPEIAAKFGRNGAEHVWREYSAAEMGKRYLAIYREVLNRRRTGKARLHQAA